MNEAQWENDNIRRKIEGIHTLPEGYEPRLDSKWELLEASLAEPKKKGSQWSGQVFQIAAAVLVVLIGTVLWWLYHPEEQPVAIPTAIIRDSGIAVQPLADSIRMPIPPVPKPSPSAITEKLVVKRIPSTEISVEKPELLGEKAIDNPADSLIAPKSSVDSSDYRLVAARKDVKHSRRYKEFDFGTPVHPVPESITTRQGVHVRLGQPVSTASPDQSVTEPAIRFKF